METSWTVIPKNKKYEITEFGEVRNKKTGRVLTGSTNNKGYKTVHIKHSDKPEFVHRLVAETFIVNDDPVHKTDVDHKDGNKSNNHVSNLEWVTRSDNVRRAYVNGLNKPSGGGHNKRKIYVEETDMTYNSQGECAKAIGGSPGGVSMQINGKRRKDTYKGYHIRLI